MTKKATLNRVAISTQTRPHTGREITVVGYGNRKLNEDLAVV
jgi:hypothetical protein